MPYVVPKLNDDQAVVLDRVIMRARSIVSICLVLGSTACVDRVFIEVGAVEDFGVVIEGKITTDAGPYTVEIHSGHALENGFDRLPLSMKQVVLSDNVGTEEVLSATSEGVYKTSATGIRGTAGRVYTLRVETNAGRIYESLPDTLHLPGALDSLYYTFKDEVNITGAHKYGFDIFFNASFNVESRYHFLWKFTATFQSDTSPASNRLECFYIGDRCNYVPPCSGLKNIGCCTIPRAIWVEVGPCTCCTCWYNLYNEEPILSDNKLLGDGRLVGARAYYVPLNKWMFQHKLHLDVTQMSLSLQAFKFWTAIKQQKPAINSLFQPVTGKIPSNFKQISGKPMGVSGLFFATAVSKKTKFLTREDVPNQLFLPEVQAGDFPDVCEKLFPNATNVKPIFWD